MMLEEKSLDKIVAKLKINKKTAFDWRHKILSALKDQEDDNDDFTGITESDETFFLRSDKGMVVTDRESRKRGGKSTKRGISNDQVAVVVTQDRGSSMAISVATLGRLSKSDLERVVGRRLYDYRKEHCEKLNLRGIAFGGRIPNYHKHSETLQNSISN